MGRGGGGVWSTGRECGKVEHGGRMRGKEWLWGLEGLGEGKSAGGSGEVDRWMNHILSVG